MTATMTSQHTQLLLFVLAGEEYALDILRVREIIEYTQPTRVPGTPASVRGMINLRGRVVPVIDLAVRFGLSPSPITPRTSIVMVEMAASDGEVVVGIITDAVTSVLELNEAQIHTAPSFGTSVDGQFLDGMAEKADERFVMLLNIDRALGADAFAQV